MTLCWLNCMLWKVVKVGIHQENNAKKILVIRDSRLENWLKEFNKNSSIYRRPIYVMSKKINIFDSQMIPCGCSGCVQVGAGECSNLVSTTQAGGPVSPDYFDLKIHDARGWKQKKLETLQPLFTEIVDITSTHIRSLFCGDATTLRAQHPLEFVCLCSSPWFEVNAARDKQCRAKNSLCSWIPGDTW